MSNFKICPVCGIEFFDRKHPDKIFCSNACYQLTRQPHITKACERCGESFTFPPSRGAVQRFCSHACQADPDKRKTIACDICGKSFVVSSRRHNAKYCSRECASIGSRKPNQYETRHCVQCNHEYRKHVIQMSKNSRFCSKQCMSDWLSTHTTGINHPRWKGGVGKNRGRNWTKQRNAALERDGYRCVICKRKATKNHPLCVHHIRPYREFAGNYRAANDMGNLITLCCHCHPRVENLIVSCPIPLL